jgi:hypothetical protein
MYPIIFRFYNISMATYKKKATKALLDDMKEVSTEISLREFKYLFKS